MDIGRATGITAHQFLRLMDSLAAGIRLLDSTVADSTAAGFIGKK